VGDLPSLKADAQGVAKIDFTSPSLTLKPGATSILDKGLIVHRDPDDYKTQPTGNSGPRVACGVIRTS
jgi:Cu-Zn family superoxide dismutase